MNALSRIPVWVWYLFSVAYCYAIWNPSFSLFTYLQGDSPASAKAVMVMVAVVVMSLYVIEGHRSLNTFGVILFVAFIAAIFWFAFDQGFRGFGYIQWWGQLIIALLMTIAVQGGRIYRALTGRVPVAADGDSGHHHHG